MRGPSPVDPDRICDDLLTPCSPGVYSNITSLVVVLLSWCNTGSVGVLVAYDEVIETCGLFPEQPVSTKNGGWIQRTICSVYSCMDVVHCIQRTVCHYLLCVLLYVYSFTYIVLRVLLGECLLDTRNTCAVMHVRKLVWSSIINI